MSAATQPPMCFSAQAPLWTRSALAAQTHRNERCHTTADVLFSAGTALDSVGLGRPDTHSNERWHATADVLFSAGAAVDSVGLGRPDTPQRALPHNRRCAFQRRHRCGLGRSRPPRHTAMSAATQPPMCFSAQAPLWTRSASVAQTHRNERCHATAGALFSASTAVDSAGLGRPDTPQRALPRDRRCAFQGGAGEGSDVPENMEYDLANMEIIKKQSKWAQQLWRTWKSEKGHRDAAEAQGGKELREELGEEPRGPVQPRAHQPNPREGFPPRPRGPGNPCPAARPPTHPWEGNPCPDTPQRALPHNCRCALQRKHRGGLGPGRPDTPQ